MKFQSEFCSRTSLDVPFLRGNHLFGVPNMVKNTLVLLDSLILVKNTLGITVTNDWKIYKKNQFFSNFKYFHKILKKMFVKHQKLFTKIIFFVFFFQNCILSVGDRWACFYWRGCGRVSCFYRFICLHWKKCNDCEYFSGVEYFSLE